MVKVSIIIPIYNGEKYLEQCIKSILCQTLTELEILCVDDGSTDNSSQIIKQFQEKDKRIRLFQQENQGAGMARNLAIAKARGKYIAFLDADDYYTHEIALQLMFDSCEKKGLSVCAGLRKRIIGEVTESDPLFQDVIKGNVLNYQEYQIDYNYQDFIFSRELLIKNGIYFPKYRRFQDPPFLVKALYEAKQFTVVETYLYCYRVTNAEFRFNSRNTYDLLCGLIDNLTFATEHDLKILFNNTQYRLEHEYLNIILKNFELDNLGILKLLMKANQIICYQTADSNYIIKPLRFLLLYANQYKKKLLQKLKAQDEFVLFGAGRYGKSFLHFLNMNDLSGKVIYIVVSDLKNNKERIENIPVITLHELQQTEEKLMFVTVGEGIQQEVKEYLDKNGYQNYEMIKDEFLYSISEGIDC